jgi:hypothetical protein
VKYLVEVPSKTFAGIRNEIKFNQGKAEVEEDKVASFKMLGYEVTPIEEPKKEAPKKAPAKKKATTKAKEE